MLNQNGKVSSRPMNSVNASVAVDLQVALVIACVDVIFLELDCVQRRLGQGDRRIGVRQRRFA